MNIALFLTGQARLNHDVYENINYFLKNVKNHNIDFFCTGWIDDENFNNLNALFKFKILDLETYNQYTDSLLLNSKKFKSFCSNYTKNEDGYNSYSLPCWKDKCWNSTPLNFYKLKRGFDLINEYSLINNTEYSIIIRLRWDCFLRNSIEETLLNDLLINNKLCVFQHNYDVFKNKHGNDSYYQYVHNWVDDLCFISNFKTFDLFSKIYYAYYDVAVKHNTWIIHMILQKYLQEFSIDIQRPSFKISLSRQNQIIDIFDYLF